MKKFLSLPLLLLLLFAACENGHQSQSDSFGADDRAVYHEEMIDIPISEQPAPPMEMEMMEAAPGGPSRSSTVSQPVSTPYDTVAKQIIKTASLVYEVKKLQEANQKIDSLVKRMGGYISSANQQNNQQQHDLNLTIRVPSRHFDKLMNALATLPERIDHKSVDARDVTEQYVDLRSRLQTKKKVAERYQELLRKANNIKEILEVEERLRILQEEIEAKEGQLRYLTHQVSYSTIHLHLYEVQKYEYVPAKTPHYGQKLLGALDGGWQMLLGLLLVIFRLWPLWIIVGLIALLIVRKQKQKQNSIPRV